MLARHDTGVSCSPVMGSATRAALRVSAARLRSRPLRPVLVVSGVALAFAMLVAVVGGSLVARQQALKRGLNQLPASARGFRVDRFGLPLSKQTYRREDRAVRRVLGTLASGEVKRVVFFRQLRIGGQLVEMAAIDGLPDVLRLRRGRLPRTCTAASCEVVEIGGRGPSRLSEGDIHLRRVGVAELHDPSLFGYISAAAEGPTAPPLLVLAPSVEALERLSALHPYYRVYSWLSPLRADRLRTWDIARTLAAESRGQTRLYDDRLRLPAEQSGRRAAERGPAWPDRLASARPRRRRDKRAPPRLRDHRCDRPAPRARRRATAITRAGALGAGRPRSRSAVRSAR